MTRSSVAMPMQMPVHGRDVGVSMAPRGLAYPRLGVIGGGQLARMTALAAVQLGCEVVLLDRNDSGPAAQLTARSLVGDWNDAEALLRLAAQVDVVSIENEFVDPDALEVIETTGRRLHPSTATLRRVQDKLIQKQTLARAGLPAPRFAAVEDPHELAAFGSETGWPVVLKTRRNGYDGKGNYTVDSAADIYKAWNALGGEHHALYVEAYCNFACELAVIVTRAADGSVAEYPVVETVQRNHICHLVRAPAPVPGEISRKAASLARRAIEVIEGVGSFGVELFLTRDGQVLVNEIAPRVHNSGHYTIEGCLCSQFENHVRAVLGWPLGSPAMVAPAAVMGNLLGSGSGPGAPQGMARALQICGAHFHIYGKATSLAGRKMGHVTALGKNLEEAEAIARQAADLVRFGGDI
jgi:5-(carboxyamino)imidazole ribonucleotide synthase